MTTKPKARKFRIRRNAPLGTAAGARTPTDASATPVADARTATDARRADAAATVRKTAQPGGAPANAPRPARNSHETVAETAETPPPQVDSAGAVGAEAEIDALRQEGLTGRQLRMARRVAQKHGLAVTSDFDAVRQLRAKGIDPFQRSNILELVVPGEAAAGAAQGKEGDAGAPLGRIQLPQTVPSEGRAIAPRPTEKPNPALVRAGEIAKIQRDMAKRRRRKASLLFTRVLIFVLLPTLLAGWYFYKMATPMFATHSEFVIQQADGQGIGAASSLFTGTALSGQKDSTQVASYLTSREAFTRLEEEHGFIAHFSDPEIDAIQRLPEDASREEAYAVYEDHVRVSYDPTDGIIRLEVIAASPEASQTFSTSLLGYAEERIDQQTQRLRTDQMAGARTAYEEAEARREEALASLLEIQQDVQQIDPVGETSARIGQISALETERQQLQLTLQSRLSVASPNQAQVDSLRSQIANIEALIADLRSEMTASDDGNSLASNNTELRLAEENYAFQTVLVQQALQQMETARLEANRQVRYLALSVEPIAPDVAAYPRAFENTAIAFLIFAGIYLMISLTASILREQVSS